MRVALKAALLCVSIQGCSGEDVGGNVAAADGAMAIAAAPPQPLSLFALEMKAKALYAERVASRERAASMSAAAKKALSAYLLDPFSVQLQGLRAGRAGAICGKYNAKNRLGAYTGFKDFVVGKDKQKVFISSNNDGVKTELYGSFSEAYLNACASKQEKLGHAYAVTPNYEPDDAATSYDPFEGV